MSTTKLPAAMTISGSGRPQDIDWGIIFAGAMRLLAVVAMVRGLAHWLFICGLAQIDGIEFPDWSIPLQATTIYLAIMDLVASVGLWMLATWGGVVWLLGIGLCTAIDLAAMISPGGWTTQAARPLIVTLADLVLVTAYGCLALLAKRQANAKP
ncbi:MAG: DUF6163 family protein [Alphaproteobacteria bacterium]|jgi:hypothetical protein